MPAGMGYPSNEQMMAPPATTGTPMPPPTGPAAGPGMPGAPAPMPGPEAGSAEPVVDSVRTIMTYAAAQQERGNPQAPVILQALQNLISALSNVAAPPGMMGEEAPPQTEGPPPAGGPGGPVDPMTGRPHQAMAPRSTSGMVPVM